ncbi:methionyl-tRNA formyltransferase [Nocardioides seonyuensis]|uniref:Methionyl-tRNA formyltransferase n=1 Tax=Nocardioides seonyuensis TaxID=2518371 RepID=A0A4P7II10_9ACTN|nr:formyltransferase family protein [Nocardioides seonyuensis]QBX55847.1 methionyl-tRNA formyltransferase [Nocardioides seonyuensis]
MRFGFITCVQLGLSCIEELEALGREGTAGDLVYLGTLHDDQSVKKSGRIYLDDVGARTGVPVTKFRHVNDADAVGSIKAADLDWLYIIGWSQIAGPDVLTATRNGVIGMHPTLLPVGRGRASVPWAIIKGLDETGVSMFQLDEGVDTGPLLGQVRIPITPTETSTTLYDKVAAAHRTLIREVHPPLARGEITPAPQDHSLATEWPGRTPADGELHPDTMTVAKIERMVRALTRPYPGAFVTQDEQTVRIWAGSAAAPSVGQPSYPVHAVDGTYWATDYEVEVVGAEA